MTHSPDTSPPAPVTTATVSRWRAVVDKATELVETGDVSADLVEELQLVVDEMAAFSQNTPQPPTTEQGEENFGVEEAVFEQTVDAFHDRISAVQQRLAH